MGERMRTLRSSVSIASYASSSAEKCARARSAASYVAGVSSTSDLYNASTVGRCCPAWMRASRRIARLPPPESPMPSRVCSVYASSW